jgi:oxygen-independent coproporphyrinogen-3 oxidase
LNATAAQNFPLWRARADLPRGVSSDRIGIYIHLPYCRTKCNYCAFVSAAPRSEAEMDRYVEALLRHLREQASWFADREFVTVFLGGGTPSLLGAARLQKIFQTLRSCYRLSPQVEITLEANPESATCELFETLVPLGLNRVSMGAQSFSDAELRRIGRVHDTDTIHRAVEQARAAGIDNLSLDLIFALPGQTLEGWQENVRQALACRTEHISCYGLSYEEGTLLHRMFTEGKVTPVLDETYAEMYDYLRQTLAASGWHMYEISNWSRPGRECRHNRLYWNRDEYLAFGVSAAGMVQGYRYGWISQKEQYIDGLFCNTIAGENEFLRSRLLSEWVELSTAEAAADAMIFGLRETQGIDLNAFTDRFGYSPLERWESAVRQLLQEGELELKDGRLRLAATAYLTSNNVLHHFLD